MVYNRESRSGACNFFDVPDELLLKFAVLHPVRPFDL